MSHESITCFVLVTPAHNLNAKDADVKIVLLSNVIISAQAGEMRFKQVICLRKYKTPDDHLMSFLRAWTLLSLII